MPGLFSVVRFLAGTEKSLKKVSEKFGRNEIKALSLHPLSPLRGLVGKKKRRVL